jgi:O-antigen/teichoic acid export membrane protein
MTVDSTPKPDIPQEERGREKAAAADLAKRVQADSIWLLLGYAITSVVGFVFWIVAARIMTPTELGIGTAHLGVITAAAAIGATAVGDALLVMLPVAGKEKGALLRMGATVLTVVAVVAAGVGVGILALHPDGRNPALIVAIVIATILWAFFVLKDMVLQGLGLIRWTLYLNGPANVAKLGFLPVLALLLAGSSWGLVLAAIVPAAIAAFVVWVVVIPRHVRAEGPSLPRVSAATRREFGLFVARGGAASGLYVAVYLVLPALVTGSAGPEQGAVYALAATVAATIDLIAQSFGSSFARHASADGRSHTGLGRVWFRTAMLALIAAVGLVAVAPIILTILGKFYLEAGGWLVIGLLAATSVINTIITLWASSLRARRATTTLLVFALVDAALLVPSVWFAAANYGAIGAAAAVLIVSALASIPGIIGLVRSSRVREVMPDVEESKAPHA